MEMIGPYAWEGRRSATILAGARIPMRKGRGQGEPKRGGGIRQQPWLAYHRISRVSTAGLGSPVQAGAGRAYGHGQSSTSPLFTWV
jgi:hypothetical protein